MVQKAGLSDSIEVDSCGTGGGSANWYRPGGHSYHEGDAADSRMTATARARGIQLTSRSRPLTPADLEEVLSPLLLCQCMFCCFQPASTAKTPRRFTGVQYDFIIGMDDSNLANIRRAAEVWHGNGGGAGSAPLPAAYAPKLSKLTDYLRPGGAFTSFHEIPDPYYSGQDGFELVMDLLDDACQGLLQHVVEQRGIQQQQLLQQQQQQE